MMKPNIIEPLPEEAKKLSFDEFGKLLIRKKYKPVERKRKNKDKSN